MTVNNCKNCIKIGLLDSLYNPGQLSHTTHDTRHTRHETRQAGPPFQELTSGWKQPESVNKETLIGTLFQYWISQILLNKYWPH